MNSGLLVPPLDGTLDQSVWSSGDTSGVLEQPTSAPAPLFPAGLVADYEHFSPYGSPIASVYGQSLYTPSAPPRQDSSSPAAAQLLLPHKQSIVTRARAATLPPLPPLAPLRTAGLPPLGPTDAETIAPLVQAATDGAQARIGLPSPSTGSTVSGASIMSFRTDSTALLHAYAPRPRLEADYGAASAAAPFDTLPSMTASYGSDVGSYTPTSMPFPDFEPADVGHFYATAAGSPGHPAHGSVHTPEPAGRGPYRVPRDGKPPRRLTTRDEANYQCGVKGCGKLFSRSYNFKAHMETHDEKREYPFPCPNEECGKRFVRKADLQRHHQSVHAKERNHKCEYCGRMFARKDTLRRHMEDGCSKRFDLGTLDLRADHSLDTGPNVRSLAGPLGTSLPPCVALPPMTLLVASPSPCSPSSVSEPGGGMLAPLPPPMRIRDRPLLIETGQAPPWTAH